MTKKIILFIGLLLSTIYLCAQNTFINATAKLPAHPRLLLYKGEESKLKRQINKDPLWREIHQAMMDEADRLTTVPVNERIMTGRRLTTISKENMCRVFLLSYAYRMSGQKKYLHRAEKEMLKAASFADWNPDHFLDVAEMNMALALGYDWLYHDLSPASRHAIRMAIREKGFLPSYVEKYNWFVDVTHNWNQICHTGLAYGALAIWEDETELACDILNRAIDKMSIPMKEYMPDGAYPEGVGYWEYGTSYNVMFLSALEKIFGTDFNLSSIPGFLQSGEYILHTTTPGLKVFNYSDNNSGSGFSPSLFWFSTKTADTGILYNQLQLYRKQGPEKLKTTRFAPAMLLWGAGVPFSKLAPPADNFWMAGGVNPIATMRTAWNDPTGMYVGVKLGSGRVNHGHLDTGSFILEAGGIPWAMDLGVENYTRVEASHLELWDKHQEAQRWMVYRYNNYSHNTLTINSQLQRVDGYAGIDDYSDNPERMYVKSDLTTAYAAEVESLYRTVALVGGKYVEVTDEVCTPPRFTHLEWNMTTPARAEILDGNTLLLEKSGQKLYLKAQCGTPFTWHIRRADPVYSFDSPNHDVSIVGFHTDLEPGKRQVIKVSLVPETHLADFDAGDFVSRATRLVEQMTLEEKVSQLRHESSAIDRLGIPAYNWWNECLHGVGRSGLATVFPQAIGLGAMWDDSLMGVIAGTISDEARAKHHYYIRQGKRGYYQGLTFWTPNINIFRDPRWGRGMETYGEDPYLTGRLGVEFVKGLQGNDPKYFKTIATAKHFVAHSGPELLRHEFDASPSPRDMAETYLPHFEKLVREARVYSVMCAYNSYYNQPCCGSKELEMLLRGCWGFDGYIVSDCGAVKDFYQGHNIVPTAAEAAAIALNAGTDLNCGSTYRAIPEAVGKGLLDEAVVDRAVIRLLTARMKLGMFDDERDVPFSSIPLETVGSEEHAALALEAARKSIVLLKNDNLLPLSKNIKSVAVIGPNADDEEVLLGNYNGFPLHPVTPLAGIRKHLPDVEVNYEPGCPLASGLPLLTPIPGDYLYTDNTQTQHGLSTRTHIDETVDFRWYKDTTSAFPDTCSIRWKGVLCPPVSGMYAIGAEGASGFKLYFDSRLLLSWKNVHHPHKEYEMVYLEAGKSYPVQIDYEQDKSENPMMRLLWEMPNAGMKEKALALAARSDVVILCMGLSPLLEGEEMKVKVDGFEGGDRLDINLPAIQTELIQEIYALGKPTVLVLMNGGALAFNWEAAKLPAILEAWYPGQEGGKAIAEIIFGDVNPSGRLPVTFYKSVSQLPAFEDYSMQGKTYRYFTDEPLYPFGHGLSYTTFDYELASAPAVVDHGDSIRLAVRVTNTGSCQGEEVAQLYVSIGGSKYPVPIRSLQGFRRVSLTPGESQTIHFVLTPEQFSAINDEGQYVYEAGPITITVGGNQGTGMYDSRSFVKHTVRVNDKVIASAGFVEENIRFAQQQIGRQIAVIEASGTFLNPVSVKPDNTMHYCDYSDWRSGYFPGSVWFLYELTKDEQYLTLARKYCRAIEDVQNLTHMHDVGLMIYCSFGNGYRLLADEQYRPIIIRAANSLISRFREKPGVLQSWDVDSGWMSERGWECPVIIDNMMNLELLFAATRLTNDSTYYHIARKHADRTLTEQFRADGSCYHVIDYSLADGSIRNRHTAQGYSHESAWSRGQAWAIYGFAVAYRETGDRKYLEQALKTFRFMKDHPRMPDDLVPYWDMDAPDIPTAPRDASSAAIIASALYEISTFDLPDADAYRKYADSIMRSLSFPAYRATPGTNGNFLLRHSVGSIPHGQEIDVPLNYADYYFLEALTRMKK